MAVFAPMSIVSMAAVHRRLRLGLDPAPRRAFLPNRADSPLLGSFGVLFGLWYVGLT